MPVANQLHQLAMCLVSVADNESEVWCGGSDISTVNYSEQPSCPVSEFTTQSHCQLVLHHMDVSHHLANF